MRYLVLPALLCLAACANDRYTPTTGNPLLLQATLSDCKHDVLYRHAYSNRYRTLAAGVGGGLGAGLVGASVAGGAAAGAIAGGVTAGAADISSSEPMPASAINPAIERCMADHGYVGTSEN